MRPIRALTLVLAFAIAFSAVIHGELAARAQSVDEAQDDAAAAERRSEVASGLVDAAIGNRTEIEMELAATIEHLNQLAEELTSLSVGLDRISEQLGFADLELAGIQTDIETRAVDAYMNALSIASIAVVKSANVEEAMVTGRVVEDVLGADHEAIDGLVVKKRNLEQLLADYETQHEAVAEKQAEFDAEVDHLTALFASADANVAEAIAAANAADAEYRAALDDVSEAKAKAAAEDRQDPSTTTTPTTSPPGTATTTTSPATTTTSGTSVPYDPPAGVEQWRSLVAQFFPSSRVDEALQIIDCESNGDPEAYNPYSSASGLFQFIPSTWASTAPAAGYPDASPFDPTANIASAAWLGSQYEALGLYFWQPWNCKRVLD